jgi:hypothetical protein
MPSKFLFDGDFLKVTDRWNKSTAKWKHKTKKRTTKKISKKALKKTNQPPRLTIFKKRRRTSEALLRDSRQMSDTCNPVGSPLSLQESLVPLVPTAFPFITLQHEYLPQTLAL